MPRSAKAVFFVALIAAFATVAVSGCGGTTKAAQPSASASTPADPVVARVNGREVRHSDVELARAEARLVGADDTEKRALRTAIDGALIGAEAERLGLSVDQVQVDGRLAAVREQLGGQTALDAALKATGMTREQLRTSLAQGVLREAVQNARYPDIAARAAAVRQFYRRNRDKLFTSAEAVNLGAFVVRNEGIAGNAVKRLEQGRPFEEVARQFSTDPELKTSAGAMGWVETAALPASLREAVARLEVNEITTPTPGPGGVWVLKLLERRPRTVVSFADARAQIQKGLDGEERSAALAKWLAAARKDASIERL